jgi:hypothetical protein
MIVEKETGKQRGVVVLVAPDGPRVVHDADPE